MNQILMHLNLMKGLNKKIILSALIIIAFCNSCKKIDNSVLAVPKLLNSEAKFFEINGNLNPAVSRINSSLKKENSKKEFVSKFVKFAGYPKWDKGFFLPKKGSNHSRQLRTSTSDSTFIIPVVSSNDRFVTGAIIATIQDTMSYKLVLLKDYESFDSNKLTLIRAMMILDAKVYGYHSFMVKDTNAIPGTKAVFFSNGNQSTNSQTARSNNVDPCQIWEIWDNPDGDACHCNGDESYTGDWYYEDEDQCFSTTPQPILSYMIGGSGQLPGNYYALPDLSGLGGGSGGGNNPPYTPTPFTEEQKKGYLIEQLNLNPTQEFYLINTEGAIATLFDYLYGHNEIERKNLAIWVLNYIPQHTDVPISTLKNWFFTQPIYRGGEDVIDPNQITYEQPLQQVALPSLSSFQTSFPKVEENGVYSEMPASDVYELVGGSLYTNHQSGNTNYQNACAIRGSRGLSYAGITIPVLKYNASQRTEKGSDNKNYILDPVSFNRFMIDKFGDTPHKLEGADANDPAKIAELLKDKNGIYVIINNDGSVTTGAGYSGHVDLILNGECVSGAYTTPTGGVKSIRVWVLN